LSRSPIIALTGATGFIGGAVARRLLREGWEVRALYRPSSRNDPVACAGLSWIPGSLEDTEALARLVAGADALVHCAGVVRGAGRDVFDRINAEGVARIAARAAAAQVPRFLLMSSLAAREPQLSPYAASKRAGEVALARTAGAMAWVVLRPPAVYGPGDRELRTLFRCIGHGLLPVLNG
jgi:nucleoside-diphosphate-sugar epimerase